MMTLRHSIALLLALVCSARCAASARADEARSCALVPTSTAALPRGPIEEALARGNGLSRLGEPARALAAYREAEQLARESGQSGLATLAAANGARMRIQTGEQGGIEAELASVEMAATALATVEARARVLLHLARSWSDLANRASEPAASAARLHAASLLNRVAELATSTADARTRSYALGQLGALYEDQGRLEEARTLTRRALFEAASAHAPDATYRWQWQLARIARAAGELEAAIAAQRSAVATLDGLRGELAAGPADAAFAFRSEVQPVYLELVGLLLERSDAVADPKLRSALLLEARNTVEAWKATELREYFRDPCLADQHEASAEAVPGAVVLYPVILPDRVELIVSSAGEITSHRVPVAAKTLEATVHELRRLLAKRTTRQYVRPASALYEWLIRPIRGALSEPSVTTLVVVPGGALRTIPFAALVDSETDQFLIEQIQIATTPGISLAAPRALDPETASVLAVGISEAAHGYPALGAVNQELSDIVALFPGKALLNAAFQSERFDEEVRARPFDIIHLASHGEFRGEASESFVLAWDGPISMDRMARTLSRTRFRTDKPLEMLVLSACMTAAGDERAALGLAGVALRAGARSALATLWSVDDAASAQLVVAFYGELAAGSSRARALQRAQQALIHSSLYRHPSYWSAFLLINSWL